MKQTQSKVGVANSLAAGATPAQATTRDFNVTLKEIRDPAYDFSALHAWLGEEQIQIAREALRKAGIVVLPKDSAKAADGQRVTLPILKGA